VAPMNEREERRLEAQSLSGALASGGKRA